MNTGTIEKTDQALSSERSKQRTKIPDSRVFIFDRYPDLKYVSISAEVIRGGLDEKDLIICSDFNSARQKIEQHPGMLVAAVIDVVLEPSKDLLEGYEESMDIKKYIDNRIEFNRLFRGDAIFGYRQMRELLRAKNPSIDVYTIMLSGEVPRISNLATLTNLGILPVDIAQNVRGTVPQMYGGDSPIYRIGKEIREKYFSETNQEERK